MWVLEGKGLPRTDGRALVSLDGGETLSLAAIYQTRADIADPGAWRAIVIHESGGATGTPQALDARARSRSLQGLEHHFVIGNGRGITDGEIYVGFRWLDQQPGAHVAPRDVDWFAQRWREQQPDVPPPAWDADLYNRHTISVCLIGDGDRGGATDAQRAQLARLVASLCAQLDIPEEQVFFAPDVGRSRRPGRPSWEPEFRLQLDTPG